MATLAAKIAGLNSANVLLTVWTPPAQFRVYDSSYAPDAFNASNRGNARFSPLEVPLTAPAGGTRIVPTMYAGDSVEVALMEVVLRDVPFPSAGYVQRLPSPAKENRRVTELAFHDPASAPPVLTMADLRANGLRRLGLTRTEVVECDQSSYGETRELARWIYQSVSTAQGIIWTSRQHGSGDAVILFGDRLGAVGVVGINANQPINGGPVLAVLMSLVGQLGATLHIDP